MCNSLTYRCVTDTVQHVSSCAVDDLIFWERHLAFQVFSYTADKEIRTDDLCLDVSRLNGPVIMLKCHHMKGNQMFEYDAEVRSKFPQQPNISKPGCCRVPLMKRFVICAIWVDLGGFGWIWVVRSGRSSVLLPPPGGAACQLFQPHRSCFLHYSICVSPLTFSPST